MDKTESKKGTISTYEPEDFRQAVVKGKWRDKAEYEKVKMVRERFREMEDAKNGACLFSLPPSTVESSIGTRANTTPTTGMHEFYDYCYKIWRKFKIYSSSMKSNIKSSLTFSNIEAAMAEFQDSDITVTMKHPKLEYAPKVRARQEIWDYIRSKGRFKNSFNTSYHECVITGTSFEYTGFLQKSRKVDRVLIGDKLKQEILDMSKDPKAYDDLQKLLNEQRKALTKEEIITKRKIGVVPVSVYDFYQDPSALCLHGDYREAADAVWRQKPSVEQVLAEFEYSTDPYVIKENLKKIKSATTAASSYIGNEKFFEAPNDLVNLPNNLEVLRYYNQQTDKYMVIANDVLLRNGPLQDDHKEIPFAKHIFIEDPFQFYGIGMAILLDDPQAVIETLVNMSIEREKKNNARQPIVNTTVFEDFDSQYDPYGDDPIEVNGSTGEENIRYLHFPQTGFSTANLIQDMYTEAIRATGVNSMQTAIPQPNQAVRNNMMSLESALKILKKGTQNWGQVDGLVTIAEQALSIADQVFPDEMVEKITETGEKIFKSITTNGVQIGKDITGQVNMQKINGKASLELRPEYYTVDEDLEIMLDMDSLVPSSRATEVQNAMDATQFLIPILSNPQLLQQPGISELVIWYADKYRVPEQVTEKLNNVSSKEDRDLAKEQNKQMLAGKMVKGIPGESPDHKYIHTNQLLDLTMQVMQEQDPIKQNELRATAMLFVQHLQLDDTPKVIAEQVIMQQTQAMLNPQPQVPVGGMQSSDMQGQPTDQQLSKMQGGATPEGMQQIGAGGAGMASDPMQSLGGM